MTKKLPPMHPGEVLREEFFEPMKLTPYGVAKEINIPRTRLERIVREEQPITADTALRLGKYFGTSAEFWISLQARYDVLTAERELAKELDKIEPHERAA